MNEIKVGQRYRWASEPYDIATITKVEGDQFWFKCSSDGYQSDALLSQELDTGTFTKANLLKEEVEESSAITPSHYNSTKIDALSVIDDWNLDFYLGNTIKYIQRHGKKGNALQDLEKAVQYLALKIKKLKDEQTK